MIYVPQLLSFDCCTKGKFDMLLKSGTLTEECVKKIEAVAKERELENRLKATGSTGSTDAHVAEKWKQGDLRHSAASDHEGKSERKVEAAMSLLLPVASPATIAKVAAPKVVANAEMVNNETTKESLSPQVVALRTAMATLMKKANNFDKMIARCIKSNPKRGHSVLPLQHFLSLAKKIGKRMHVVMGSEVFRTAWRSAKTKSECPEGEIEHEVLREWLGIVR